MSAEEAFTKLKDFLETHEPCIKAIKPLKTGVEIGLVVGPSLECAVHQKDGKVVVERRPAKKPDIIFRLSPDAIYVIIQNAGKDVGDLAVAIVKEILVGSVKVSVPGNVFNIMKNGYFDMLKEGGQKLWEILATKGLTNAMKIMAFIQKVKK